jgi:hypothetical protein
MLSWLRGHESPERAAARAAPFKAKGLVFQGALAFYDQNVPGGSAEVLKTLAKTQPSAEEFFAQSFVAGGWYDVTPIVPLSQAAAHVAGMAQQRLIRDNAAWLARRDLNGVYKAVLSLASPEVVAKRLPGLSLRYFDFGGTDEVTSTAKSLSAVRTGIPHSLADWFMHCMEGFVPVALALAGAVDVRVRCTQLAERGAATDGAIVSFKIDVSWT